MDELTEEQVSTIDRIAKHYARKLAPKFGAFDSDDFYQRAWIEALEHLDGYSEARGDFGAYMGRVIYSKLLNYKRGCIYDRRGCKKCRRGGSADFCKTCHERQSLKCPLTRELPIERLSQDDPQENAMIREWAEMIERLSLEEAAAALGCPELSAKECRQCGQRKQLSDFGPCKNARDGRFSACMKCRERPEAS